MPVIDDKGRLFGKINIIDALAILFVLAVIVAGVALVTGGDNSTSKTSTQTVVFDIGQQPQYIIDAIEEGSVEKEAIVAVKNKTVIPAKRTDIPLNCTDQVRLTVALTVSETADGLPMFKGERLYIGRQVRLDLWTTIVNGTVVTLRSQ
ncbi:DUF4330 domain-containing protein [Halovenus marina]|uniref:DUF4330 domain-containing protein n=1 Tax=Halovenus marina TaxID=3396621 RepID=UPI003F5697EB